MKLLLLHILPSVSAV